MDMTFKVRVSGTAPVWADIEVDAKSAEEAISMVNEGSVQDIAFTADWQFCDGGNGVDDWCATGDVYGEDYESLMEDGEYVIPEEIPEEDEEEDE
jgi:hypothetical protein